MNAPAVSVILPAYNCEKFIGKAIQSMLQQTFPDFELIIVNDGSSDKTETVIYGFNDPRIIYHKNPENKGLIYSLNRAIELADGKYIARMDSDDISLPGRLEKQKAFLDKSPHISVAATTIDFINQNEEKIGQWDLDRQTITAEQIEKQMPYENCIAHPTVMIRSEVLKTFKYKNYQKNIEDYDLWLRLLNRRYQIEKINEPLLLYRQHDASVTSVHLKKLNPFFKHLRMKRRFLAREILSGHISWFTFRVKGSAIVDFIKGAGKAIKNLFH